MVEGVKNLVPLSGREECSCGEGWTQEKEKEKVKEKIPPLQTREKDAKPTFPPARSVCTGFRQRGKVFELQSTHENNAVKAS